MQRKIQKEARDNCDESGNEKSVAVYEFGMRKTMGRTGGDGSGRVKSFHFHSFST